MIADRVNERMQLLGLSQHALARKVGVSQPAIKKLCDGNVLKPRFIVELAEALEVTVEWLNTGNGEKEAPAVNYLKKKISTVSQPVLLLGTAQAGQWIEVGQSDEATYIHLPLRDDVDPAAYHALQVKGNSMNKTALVDGSTILCLDLFNYPGPLESGMHVVVQRYDGMHTYELTVKELQISPDGNAWLYPRSTDPSFKPLKFDLKTLTDDGHIDHDAQVAIRSVVVGVVPPLGLIPVDKKPADHPQN